MSRRSRGSVAMLVTIVTALVVVVWLQIRTPNDNPRDLPASGYAYNDTGGKMVADPQNGVQGLQAIHKIITHYRAKKSGACALSYGSDIIRDVSEHPSEYGYASKEEALRVFHNPDARLSDPVKSANAKETPNLYIMSCQRTDGTNIGDPKPDGKKDVLAWTPMYVYQNTRLYPNQRMTHNPVGYYLVLWEDGEVERIPYDKVVYTPISNVEKFVGKKKQGKQWTVGFAGQAGVSPEAFSYDAWWQRMGMKRGPRGKEGG